MLNGRLEDAAVGIGSVARERRKGFCGIWQQAYWLQPLEGGALLRSYPDDWHLFRQDSDGYRLINRARPIVRIPTRRLHVLPANGWSQAAAQRCGSLP